MKHLFQLCLLLTLAGAAPFTLSSCSKKEEPAPTTGDLGGTISPAGTITKVTATFTGGATFFATPDATSGAFSFEKLAPGKYTLRFTPATGYQTPKSIDVNIIAGQTASAGTVTVESDGTFRSGTLTWTVNGTTVTTTNVQGQYLSSGYTQLFYFTATAPNGNNSDELKLQIQSPRAAPYTYDFAQGNDHASVNYRRINPSSGLVLGNYGGYTYSTNGTFTINSLTNNLATGTFGFVAQDQNGSGNMTVTNGTFRLQF